MSKRSVTERQRLPNRRASQIVEFEHAGHCYRVSASYFGNGRLAEIFLDTGKSGSDVQQHAEASIALQYGVPVGAIAHSLTGPIATALRLLSEGRTMMDKAIARALGGDVVGRES
jgi:hypothetical protein